MTAVRVTLPVPEPPPQAPRLPVFALVAPALLAATVWLATGQVLSLLFAALGPAGVLAAFADQWWSRRRSARAAMRRFDTDVAAAENLIRREHDRELDDLLARFPDGARLVRDGADEGLWRGRSSGLALGTGIVPSALEPVVPTGVAPWAVARLDVLAERARRLHAPVVIDGDAPVGIVGPDRVARACWRGYVVQLARRFAPDDVVLDVGGDVADELRWIGLLPHERRTTDDSALRLRVRSAAAGEYLAAVAVAETPERLPRSCVVVLTVREGMLERQTAPGDPVEPVFVSVAEATAWARRIASTVGADARRAAPPEAAELEALLGEPASDERGLECVFAVDAAGPVPVDLVEHGPHAVVAGTTGSGKSELLVSWVVAMAARYPPSRVTFLLVDFKGGAAFAPLAALPHVVGVVTDLDAERAERALVSLRAELRRRERLLASGERTPARLVIVVDEFAALVDSHPALYGIMSDLAARGRSLGMHLLLCTQRPTGVVRDGLLANADLRVCLRVNNDADSRAVVDDTAAARIDPRLRGRAVIRRAGEPARLVHVARAAASDIESTAARWVHEAPPHRPWREPLPDVVHPRDLEGTAEGVAFGLVDLPAQQRWGTAVWRPDADGHVLVLGAPRSGRTTTLAALTTRLLPSDPPSAWDEVAALVGALDAGALGPERLGIDDLDALVARFDVDHRAAFVTALSRVLRDGSAHGLHVAASASRLTGDSQVLAGLFPSVMRLRHSSRHDWVLGGGDGAIAHLAGPPGSGRWRGERVQVARVPAPVHLPPAPGVVVVDARRPLAVVAGTPAVTAMLDGWRLVGLDEAAGALAPGEAAVGDPDEWQSRWGLLARLRATSDIVFAGCAPADVRLVARTRRLPPPLPPGDGLVWLLQADGTLRRARLHPPGPPSRTMESA